MNNLDNSQSNVDFDFDEWMELYKRDPESFDKKREELIRSAIHQTPIKMHRRLNGLQWRIDTEIKLARNPLDGCIKIYEMMMDSVYESGGLMDALSMTPKIENKLFSSKVIKLKSLSKEWEMED